MFAHVYASVPVRRLAGVSVCLCERCWRQVSMRTVLLVNQEDGLWSGNVTIAPTTVAWTTCWDVGGSALDVSFLPTGAALVEGVGVDPYGTTLIRCSAVTV